MHWYDVLSAAISGTFLIKYGEWNQRRKDRKRSKPFDVKMPYIRTCSHHTCYFKVSGSSEAQVRKFMLAHEKISHGKGQAR